jgi:hypothetical protein
MSVSVFVLPVLAALSAASTTPAPAGDESLAKAILPNRGPLPTWWDKLLPYLGIAAAVLVALLIIGLIVIWIRRRPGPPPLTPTELALRDLEALRHNARTIEPYQFSVAVSDVLRTFIGHAKFQLPATKQTSPEFLAAIAHSTGFTDADRSLLARFLEKCDMIKFARLQATSADNTDLVESALNFVRGEMA